jgi:DNA-directed RNA polymerase subunit RPC12/RpoP
MSTPGSTEEIEMHCARCGTIARKIHRPLLLRLLPLAQLYYCWPCHRRFIRIAGSSNGTARAAR